MRRHSAGFTLLELMVTIAIIGLLASVAVPEYDALITRTRQTNFTSMFTTYHTMIVNYYRQNAHLPPGSFYFVSEPALGPSLGDISGWTNSKSPYFPGNDIPTAEAPGLKLYADDYQTDPWRSLVAFGAPTLASSTDRYMLYASPFGDLLILYGFHNFNHSKTASYDYELYFPDQSSPDGLLILTGSYTAP